jgi:hypothetical protein
MSVITKNQAKEIAIEHLAKTRSIEITDVWGDWHVYGADLLKNCWYILTPASDLQMLTSRRLIAISKETGEVLYDGSTNEEG